MSVNESIYQYYLQQFNTVQKSCEGFDEFPDSELVHKLRLGIKKLRALDLLAENLMPENKSKIDNYSAELKSLFKIAGKLRDTQVQLHLLITFEENNNCSFPEFKEWLAKNEKNQLHKLRQNWKNHFSCLANTESCDKTLELFRNSAEEAILHSAAESLSRLYTIVKGLAGNEITDEVLHKIRIVTKQMRYIYGTVIHGSPEFIFSTISIEMLREIEKAVGYWHDCLIRIELFNKFILKDSPSDHEKSAKLKKYSKIFNKELKNAYRQACKISVKGYSGKV